MPIERPVVEATFLLCLIVIYLGAVLLLAEQLAHDNVCSREAVLVCWMSVHVLLHSLDEPNCRIHRCVARGMQRLRKFRRLAILAHTLAFCQCGNVRDPLTARASRGLCESYVAAPAGGGRGWVPCRWSERTLSCEKGPPRECA